MMPTTRPPCFSAAEWIVLAAFFLIYIAALAVFWCLGKQAFRKTHEGGAKSFGMLFQRAIPFFVVAAILLAIVVLAALDKLTSEVVTLLGSLASFSLGIGGKALARRNNGKNSN